MGTQVSIIEGENLQRPRDYDPEIAATVCLMIAQGEKLANIEADHSLPTQKTIWRWLHEVPEFKDQYMRARASWAHAKVEEIIEIADQYDTTSDIMNPDLVARAKLRIDARKWAVVRFNYKEFGDKPETPVGGGGNTLNQTTININTVPVGSRILEDGTIIEGEVVPADKKEINHG